MKRNLLGSTTPIAPVADDDLLIPKEAAAFYRLSLPAFYKGVRDGRIPAPVYPAERAPRWIRSELRAALLQTRMRPTDQVAATMIRKAAMAKQAA